MFLSKNVPAAALFVSLILLTCSAWPQEDSPAAYVPAGEKNPDTALLWSLVGTAIPVVLTAAKADPVLVATAWLVGPSPGYFYGGPLGRGLLGIGIRVIGESILLLGGFITWMESWSSDEDNEKKGESLIWGGIGIVLASTIWDLATVKGAVQKRNLRLRKRTLALSPVFLPQARAVGVRIKVQF